MHSANVHPDFTSHFAAPPPQLELLPQAFLYVAPRSGENKSDAHDATTRLQRKWAF